MTNIVKKIFIFTALLLLPVIGMAQTDNFGKTDTIYAEVAKIDSSNWSITVSFTNDEPVVALSVPLKMTSGTNKIVADSAIYVGGRVEHFAYKAFRPDTAIQCVTLGMIGTLSAKHINLPAGSGRLVTVFVSSMDKKPIETLKVDTTTTNPNNSLMIVGDYTDKGGANLTQEERNKYNIYPAFVVIEPKS